MKKNAELTLKLRVQNLVRGALSMLKTASTPEAKRDMWHQEQMAHQQIHRALSLAKSKLKTTEVSEIEGWVGSQLRKQSKAKQPEEWA
ncbi:hypothetical protein [Polaromonas sp.]|uniref:hypothetical protein n=1 Tax=Polaromonas sp. TaxID=1869339 RepID=UPI003BABFA6E